MPDRVESADVVVVGCGPGGAVLGYLLARSGVDVALIERAGTFEREYRGFGWNPGVIRLFDEMDLLEDVHELAHETVTEGTFTLYGEEVTVLDMAALDTEYPYAVLMEQPALLERVVERAAVHDGFAFHPATTVTDLRRDDAGGVVGVDARDRREDVDIAVEGRLVVGADGRYSTVRERAGIDPGLFDSPIDLVWFKLPTGAVDPPSQGRIGRHGVLLYFGLGTDELQVGYPVLDGQWHAIRAAGFGAFCDRLGAIDGPVAEAARAHLDDLGDTTLLDVAPGVADCWSHDGLLLLGDAAHTASPVGAQGNPLAVEDAVVAHDLIVGALGADDGPLTDGALAGFESRRRPTVERVIALQRRVAALLSRWLAYGRYVPPPLVRWLAAVTGWVIPRSPRFRRALASFALGDRSVSVARDRFVG